MLSTHFFDRDAIVVAKDLLGKVMRVKYIDESEHFTIFLSASIIETEAYYIHDRASHASLGFTLKRKALFMQPGTIYMYHSRAGASMNISVQGEGNAVLIKSGFPFIDTNTSLKMLDYMQKLNPNKNGTLRPINKLCSGQTLLCRALGLTIKEWDQQQFSQDRFFIENVGYKPAKIIQTTRLGIRQGRDEHLLYRFIDYAKASYCTSNPLNHKYLYDVLLQL